MGYREESQVSTRNRDCSETAPNMDFTACIDEHIFGHLSAALGYVLVGMSPSVKGGCGKTWAKMVSDGAVLLKF